MKTYPTQFEKNNPKYKPWELFWKNIILKAVNSKIVYIKCWECWCEIRRRADRLSHQYCKYCRYKYVAYEYIYWIPRHTIAARVNKKYSINECLWLTPRFHSLPKETFNQYDLNYLYKNNESEYWFTKTLWIKCDIKHKLISIINLPWEK